MLPLHDAALAYAAAKAALTNYSKGLSNQVASQGVRVVAVAPGFIETAAATRLMERLAVNARTDFNAARQGLTDSLGGITMGRPGQPHEVAEDVIVHDEGEEYRGIAAIASWIDTTTQKYHTTVDVTNLKEQNAEMIVTAQVSGSFDGSPIPLQYHFTLEADMDFTP